MGKQILSFGDDAKKSYQHKSPVPLTDVDTEIILASHKIPSGEKITINTLLVTCIMMTKLSHYIYCFLKQRLK